jgi:hypothetical protein
LVRKFDKSRLYPKFYPFRLIVQALEVQNKTAFDHSSATNRRLLRPAHAPDRGGNLLFHALGLQDFLGSLEGRSISTIDSEAILIGASDWRIAGEERKPDVKRGQ